MKAKRWAALPAGDRMRLLLMMLALPSISLSLRIFGYVRTRRLAERLSRHPQPHAATPGDVKGARRLAQLADIAGRHGIVEETCLRQALLVLGLLRRRGLRPELKLGVRREGNAIAAHAWIELDGVSMDPRASQDHHVFPEPATNETTR